MKIFSSNSHRRQVGSHNYHFKKESYVEYIHMGTKPCFSWCWSQSCNKQNLGIHNRVMKNDLEICANKLHNRKWDFLLGKTFLWYKDIASAIAAFVYFNYVFAYISTVAVFLTSCISCFLFEGYSLMLQHALQQARHWYLPEHIKLKSKEPP